MNSLTELALTVPAEAFLSPSSIDASPGLANLPDEPRTFVGRDDELLAISRGFAEGAMMQALSGLGGVGKTTLAAQWTVQNITQYHPVWWIDGSSAESITAGLAHLGGQLQDLVAKLFTEAALCERAKQWLATHSGWLLVLDNVNNPDDVRFLKAIARNRGRVLITTRLATGWHDVATAVPVRVLTQAAAVDLFTQIYTESGQRETGGIVELCAELGYLALAIQQAAAYCVLENGMTAPQYLAKMAEVPDVMHQAPYEGLLMERTMAGVWEPSLDRLADTPFAGDLLRILAWFPSAEYGFPNTRIPRKAVDTLVEPPQLVRALGRLAAHSLIGLDQKYIHVHRVVQAVVRTPRESSVHRSQEQVDAARTRAELLFQGFSPNGSRAVLRARGEAR
ncbi:NB-ARC domain-containing protein [Streptomyces rubiginosohelvolus]|uniref:NB-ARC domain-containing protein n=1 Tax=Streptomyces rubiginosohelvolus TaxID=67362 RepID=UPI0037FED44E